jgi:hypothetical protein
LRAIPATVAAALAVGLCAAPAVGASAASASSTASTPDGAITVRLLDASAARENDPRARIYIDDHVPQGTTVVRHVEVTSTVHRAVSLRFYPDAATVGHGSFVVAAGHGRNDLTSWTTVTPAAQTLSPGARVVLTVTIAVPNGVASGERYGVILADLPPVPGKPGTLAVGSRVGIRVYLSVGTGAEPRTDFRVDSLTASRSKSGRPMVSAAVHNTGGRAVDLSGTLTLDHGPGGLRAGPYPVTLGTTLGIGQTAPVTVALDPRLPAGPWHARLILTSGTVTRGAEATLTFPTAFGTSGPVVAANPLPLTQRKSVLVPFASGLLGLLALAFLLLWLLRRHKKKKAGDDEAAPRSDRELVRSI